jgi:hypothetical protein
MRTVALFFSLLFKGMFFRLIGLPLSANHFNEVLHPPTLAQLRDFFHSHPQDKERAHAHIKIGAFSPLHRLLAKIVQHNLWPTFQRSELVLKRAQFLYAIVMRLPFCLCKHILNIMLESRDDHATGLPLLRTLSRKLFFSLI